MILYTMSNNGAVRDANGKLIAVWDGSIDALIIDGVQHVIYDVTSEEQAFDIIDTHFKSCV